MNLNISPTSKELTVYGNIKSNVVCGATKAKLKIDYVSEEVELWVVQDEVQEYDLIVGRTFTDKDNVTFIKTNNEVIFDYNMVFPFAEVEYCTTNMLTARSSQNQILRANEVNIVKATVNQEELEVLLVNYSQEDEVLNKGDYAGKIRTTKQIPYQKENNQPDRITDSMVICGPMITETDKVKLMELINQYRCCFALNMSELGCTDLITVDIEDDGHPVVSKPYR